jgi:glucosamine-6-phosphate deaminase
MPRGSLVQSGRMWQTIVPSADNAAPSARSSLPYNLLMATLTTARLIPATHPPVYMFESGSDLARHVAQIVAGVIRERNALGQNAVLGLPTGSTPVGVYRELIRMHREEGLDFSNVITFNVDEYYGVPSDQLQSYHRWMHEHLFHHVNIYPENIHIPDGTVPLERIDRYCRDYEAQIDQAGGIDVLLLGIGRNGHIGFNEPFSIRNSRTRLCTLDPVTRQAAASQFFGEHNVPTQAITMGLGTLLDARKIMLLALGEHKAAIIRETAEGPVTDRVPASFLQDHPDSTILVDAAAGRELTGSATPWLLGNVATGSCCNVSSACASSSAIPNSLRPSFPRA